MLLLLGSAENSAHLATGKNVNLLFNESEVIIGKVSGKLTQVATVPQVMSYLLTGEADAGFVNLTEALANKDNLGGYIIVPEDAYKPIEIVAGTVTGFEDKELTIQFISYLKGDTAKEVLLKYTDAKYVVCRIQVNQ
jgi:molybdenum ABC transporter molybdate-binding protein